jgi:hypothetical protein
VIIAVLMPTFLVVEPLIAEEAELGEFFLILVTCIDVPPVIITSTLSAVAFIRFKPRPKHYLCCRFAK